MGLFGKKNKNEEQSAPPPPAAPVQAPVSTPAPAAQAAPAPQAMAPAPAAPVAPPPEPVAAAPAPSSTPAAAPASEPQPAPVLSEEAAQKAVRESQQAMLAVGHVMVFMLNAPDMRQATLEQLRSIVLPGISNQQFIVAMARSNQTGHITPAGVAIWAKVSDAIDQRLSVETDKPFNLSANDWNSGPNPWLIMLAGAPAAINPMVADMKKELFPDRPLKMRIAQADGSVVVTSFQYDPNTHEAIKV